MKLLQNYGGLSKARVAGTTLLLALSLLVSGCGGGGGDDTATLLAAQQAAAADAAAAAAAAVQKAIDATNTSIIESSVSGLMPGMMPGMGSSGTNSTTPAWGKVAGTSQIKNVFGTFSSSSKSTFTTTNTYSVDTSGRLTNKIAVTDGGMGSTTSDYSYEGATTRVLGLKTASVITGFGTMVNTNAYTYDSTGRITGAQSTFTQTPIPPATPTTGTSTTIIVYDTNGRTQTSTNKSSTPGSTVTTVTTVYDKYNNLISYSDGTQSSRSVCTYDASGNQLTNKTYMKTFTMATEMLYSDTTSTYGPNGVLTETTKFYDSLTSSTPTGAIVYTGSTKYTYDASGNELTNEFVFKDASGVTMMLVRTVNVYKTLVSGIDNQ